MRADGAGARMMNRLRRCTRWVGLAVVIGAMAIAAQPQTASSQADLSSLLDVLAPAVVQVETPLGSGSGFVVEHRPANGAPSWGIVTACHVVSDGPRDLTDASAARTAQVTFTAWGPSVQIEAVVERCVASADTALLQPVNAADEVTTLGERFATLAEARNNPDLRSFPRLWLGESDGVRPLQSIFSVGYPGPFSEFNAVRGNVSGELPRLFITAQDGPVYRVSELAIFDAAEDEPIRFDQGDVLQRSAFPAMGLSDFPEFVQRLLDSGRGVLLQGSREPTFDRPTGWEVVGLENGVAQVRERPVVRDQFGQVVGYEPRSDRSGQVDQERVFFRVNAPLISGFSGAPVFNLSGQVIGMVEWGINVEGGHFVNPVDEIRETLFESR